MTATLVVRKSTVSGVVPAPPSKSHTHRAILMGLLAPSAVVHAPLLSDDTLASLRAAIQMGAKLRITRGAESLDASSVAFPVGKPLDDALALDPGTLHVEGGSLQAPRERIDCANSGTTIRVATGIAALLDKEVTLDGDASLRTRPMQPMLDALGHIGATARGTNGTAPVTVRGPLRGGLARIRGDVSSQFVSGLLIAGSRAPEDVTVRVTSPLKSAPYVEVTNRMLARFGVKVERTGAEFKVAAGQPFRPTEYTVPGDWSSAAFPLVAAAVTSGKVTVENLSLSDPQGDKAIVDMLRRFGATVTVEGDEMAKVTVEGNALQGTEIDVGNTPDLFPILAVLGASARGTTVLENAEHVRYKESDRVGAMARGLERFGCVVQEARDALVIQGGRRLRGATLDTRGDHRILMAFAVAGLVAQGETRLTNPESAAVSYPAFVGHFRQLGASLEVTGIPGERSALPLSGPRGGPDKEVRA